MPVSGWATSGIGSASTKGVSTTGHCPVTHDVPPPWYVPPCAAQSACVVTRQPPDARQHAPVARPHGSGSQTVLSPLYSPFWAAHDARVVTMHPPAGRQHAPIVPAGGV